MFPEFILLLQCVSSSMLLLLKTASLDFRQAVINYPDGLHRRI
jgi:hypothetical protein